MKSTLKWGSLFLAIIAVVVAIYILSLAISMWPTDAEKSDPIMPHDSEDAISLLIASTFLTGGGPVLLCVGAFKGNKAMVGAGAVVLVCGLAVFFAARAVNVRYIYG